MSIPVRKEYFQTPPGGDGIRRQFSYDVRDLPDLPAMIRKDATGAGTMHAACFVCHLALRFDLATVDEVVGDYGLVHELAHIRHIGPKVTPEAADAEGCALLAADLIARIRKAAGVGP